MRSAAPFPRETERGRGREQGKNVRLGAGESIGNTDCST